MCTAQTGSGKTAAFLVPIITSALQAGPKELKDGAVCPTCVVLTPTRHLKKGEVILTHMLYDI